MSALNGDRARFHKDRKRKLHHRQLIQALAAKLRKRTEEQASSRAAAASTHDEGAPLRIAD
jgi:crotonobetainyl-CoA:carnitine CoA-transferase CaiB-like acyl-CoA transferase